jgi:hypothetical protein
VQYRAYAHVLLSGAALANERYADAVEHAEHVVDEREGLGVRHWLFKTGVRHLLEATLASGDVDTAARHLAELEDIPPGGRSPSLDATIERFRACVAAAAGDEDADRIDGWFRSSETILGEAGFRFELARVQLEHATWLRSLDRDDEASSVAAAAAEAFGDLRATPWLERARSLARADVSA